MALGTNHLTTTTHANFIPEMWSDEVIGAYKSNLVLANLVTKIMHNGKKGDTIHVPNVTRGAASAKAASTEVTLITATEGVTDLLIDKHYEYSRMIEDIVAVQALDSYRKFYTDDAGYALAKQVDQHLMMQSHHLQGGVTPAAATLFEQAYAGGDGSTKFSGAAGSGTGNGTDLSDIGLRTMVQYLDDADYPMGDRVIVIPPCQKKVLTGLSRFTEQAFVGDAGSSNTIRTGLVGDIYGMPVYVSSNCMWIHVNSVTSTQSGTFTSTAPTGTAFADAFGVAVDWSTSTPTDTKYRAGMILHKSAIAHVEQMGIRSQTQYKQEYLGDLFTADTIYGVGELRNDGGVTFVVPA